MPEFILNTDGVVKSEDNRVAFYAMPLLAQGYIKALFWNNTDGSIAAGTFDPENGAALPEEVGYSDLAYSALSSILEDCASFTQMAGDLIAEAEARGYSEESVGHDFYMTRSGSGVGFTDRAELGLIGADKAAVNALFEACNAAYAESGDTGPYRELWRKAMDESKRLSANGPAERFTAIAKAFGSQDVYLGDDGKVWL